MRLAVCGYQFENRIKFDTMTPVRSSRIMFVFVLLKICISGLGLRSNLYSISNHKDCSGIISASRLHLSEKNAIQDILNIKLKIIKQVAPIFGYYAIMLAPIYGIGLLPFLGSMTEFSSLRNRGLPGIKL